MVFPIEIYKKRRKALIKSMPESSVLLIPAWPEIKLAGNVEGHYQTSSDLLYFSGFEEPKACLMVLSTPPNYILFVQKKDPEKELWTGPIHGPEETTHVFHTDTCYPLSEFSYIAPEILKNIQDMYYSFGTNPFWDEKINTLIHTLREKKRVFLSLHDPISLIAPLRMKKSSEEIKLIKQSVSISAKAHNEVIKHCRPGISERELHGRFLFEIMKRGASGEAYPGIFASGDNTCTLHYTLNNRTMKKGELMLVDAGAKYHHYSADITRTFPVNNTFSKAQKKLYIKLLKIQKNLINFLKPGVFFKDIQNLMIKNLSHLMKEENLLSGSIKKIIEQKKYKKYSPHSFGHLLGMDVHDITFSKTKDLKLKPGFVLTIEPGLYLPPEDLSLKPELRGIGIRIEDDILITKKGVEVLSKEALKEVEELEILKNS